jgi:hypothetical protein
MITLVIGVTPRRARNAAERARALEGVVPDDEFGGPVIVVPGEAHADSNVERTTTTKLFIRTGFSQSALILQYRALSLGFLGHILATSPAGTPSIVKESVGMESTAAF